MSTTTTKERGRQFPVGRRRSYVPVVDAGCGCRPRRPRLLTLPSFSFLKPRQLLGCNNNTTAASAGAGEKYSCSSTSTAASFSSSSAATHTTGGYSSSAYSDDYYYYNHHSHIAKLEEAPLSPSPKQHQATKASSSPAKRQLKTKAAKKKRKEKKSAAGKKKEEEDGGVGVAVEKDSSDPRADFRDSMVQMVVEMGLCDWDGLRGMLGRLLALNAPRHHAAILAAFAEVCTQLAAAAAATTPTTTHHHQPSPPPAYYHQYRR